MSSKEGTLIKLKNNNEQLESIFERLQEIDSQLLNRKMDENSWSVIEILNHLHLSEELTLNYLKYKMESNSTFEKETFRSKYRFILMMFLYTIPNKFKAPEKISNPSNEDTLETIQEKFAKLRAEFNTFYLDQDDGFFKLATCKHPAVGRIRADKMLRFFNKHTTHHEKQILRRLISFSS